MLVSVNSVIVPTAAEETEIRIKASNVEALILADDLYEDAEAEEVAFVFDRTNLGHRKYLVKFLQSQRGCRGKASLGAMLDALPGSILSISEAFLER